MQVDFLIIGQGLAGSLLARACRARGASVLVVDNAWRTSASQVAAGLMTPLTGKRFTLTPDYPALFKKAEETFTSLGVFQPKEVYRFFVDAEQRQRAERRSQDPDCQPFMVTLGAPGYQTTQGLVDPWGGALLKGAWVQLPKLLATIKSELESAQSWRGADFDFTELQVDAQGVTWREVRARGVVFCDGYRSAMQGPFRYLPWQPAKGEVLDLKAAYPAPSFILNRDGWALPLGDGRWRTGTNWAWDELNEQPTSAQREKLLGRFHGFFAQPASVEVTGHTAGVRPCTSDNHPFLGTHPECPVWHLFNGLGPRGTIWAPALAEQMADYLITQRPLPPSVDLRRFR